jgi:hypothetical protein
MLLLTSWGHKNLTPTTMEQTLSTHLMQGFCPDGDAYFVLGGSQDDTQEEVPICMHALALSHIQCSKNYSEER